MCQASWAAGAAILGLALSAYAQAPDAAPSLAPGADPQLDRLIGLIESGGLPVVLGVLGWALRGVVSSGIPIVVQLGEEDRAELRRLRRALEDRQDDGGSER